MHGGVKEMGQNVSPLCGGTRRLIVQSGTQQCRTKTKTQILGLRPFEERRAAYQRFKSVLALQQTGYPIAFVSCRNVSEYKGKDSE